MAVLRGVLSVGEVGIVMVLAIVLAYGVFLAGASFVADSSPAGNGLPEVPALDPRGMTPMLVVWLLAAQSIAFVALGSAMRLWRCGERLPLMTADTRRLVRGGLLVGGIAVVAGFLLELLHSWAGFPVQEQPWIVDMVRDAGGDLAILLPMIVIVGPVGEEVFFRGYMFPFLRRTTGAVPAAGVSALYFAAVHFNPSGLLAYVLLGLLFAWAMHRWRSILVPVLAHGVNNLIAVGLLMLGQHLG